jgi:hypothetical protein
MRTAIYIKYIILKTECKTLTKHSQSERRKYLYHILNAYVCGKDIQVGADHILNERFLWLLTFRKTNTNQNFSDPP